MIATASHVAETSASCNAASVFIGAADEVRPADRPRYDEKDELRNKSSFASENVLS